MSGLAIDKLARGLWFGAIMAILSFCGQAMGQTITIGENDIVSLTNTPVILDAEGSVDQAGRPSLHFRLSFANECLRDTGVDVKFAQTDTGATYIFVFQRIPIGGCPDIFNPVESRVQALLPSSLTDHVIRLVARPLNDDFLSEIALNKKLRDSNRSDQLLEATRYSNGMIFPVFDVERIVPAESGRGYNLTGTIIVNPACIPGKIGASVYEIPDRNGEPARDAVLFFAPQTCYAQSQPVRVTVAINSPQTASGREIFTLNSRQNKAYPIIQ